MSKIRHIIEKIERKQKNSLTDTKEGKHMAVLAKPINKIAIVKEKESRKFVREFNKNKVTNEFLDSCKKAGKSYQDFSSKMQLFNAGSGYENFNDFIVSEASEYKNTGDGVTYVVWNILYDKDNIEIDRDIVS